MTLLLVAFLLLSLALLLLGLRGYAIDDHPLCRKCGFDLTGKPETSTRCPECGADLTKPKSIRVGHRKRRHLPLFAGSLLLLMTIGGFVLTISHLHWIDYAPNWWLTYEIASSDAATRKIAIRELQKRITRTGKFSKSQGAALADRVLSLQADLNRPWVIEWGNLLEDARENGLVPDKAWRRYMLQAPQLQLALRPTVRLGDPIVWAIRINPSRVGSTQHMDIKWRLATLTVGPISFPALYEANLVLTPNHGSNGFGIPFDLPPEMLKQISARKFTASMDLPIQVIDSYGKIDAAKTLTLEAPITFVTADVQTVKLVRDESLAGAMIKSLHCSTVQPGYLPDTLDFTITLDNCPTGVGFHVFAVTGGREYPGGYIMSLPQMAAGPYSFGMTVTIPGFTGDKIDFVLKPSPAAAAARTLDLTQIWDGRLEFDGIKVIRATTSPTSIPTSSKSH